MMSRVVVTGGTGFLVETQRFPWSHWRRKSGALTLFEAEKPMRVEPMR